MQERNITMKKLLVILPVVIMLAGCAPEAEDPLPAIPAGTYSVVLDANSSTLTTDDSTEPLQISLQAKENSEVTYEVEIGAPCYLKTVDGYTEMIVKQGAYFKSKSSYKVNRLICDIFEGKGINYEVHDKADGSGNALERHESSITPVYEADSGAVYEYDLNSSTEWSITNSTKNKPAFYSVTIIFVVE